MRTLLFVSFLFLQFGNQLVCQTPDLIGYQAIITKNDNSLVSNQKIGIEISIWKNQLMEIRYLLNFNLLPRMQMD